MALTHRNIQDHRQGCRGVIGHPRSHRRDRGALERLQPSDPRLVERQRRRTQPFPYTYHQEKDGKEITVDSSEVENTIIHQRNGRVRTEARRRDPVSGKVKFVKAVTGALFPLDLVETGPHRVTVAGYASNDDLFGSRLFPRPPGQWVIASAEAGGGDVRMLAWDPNADFDAYLIPVERGLGLGARLEGAVNLAHWLRALGIALPGGLEGGALIAH